MTDAAACWEVVGGGDKGGILVRDGSSTSSKQLEGRLSTGSRVEELGRVGDRIHYRLISGSGPDSGWVSITLKDKELLRKVEEEPAAQISAADGVQTEQSHADATQAAVDEALTEPEPAAAQKAGAEAAEAPKPAATLSEEELALAKSAESWWMDPARRKMPASVEAHLLDDFLAKKGEALEPPGDYLGGQLPVMPRTVGLPTYAAVPEKAKKLFPEKARKPMIRLYCFPGAADNYMLWLELATSAPDWCEVAVYEPRAHGFRPEEAWDRSLEERAEDALLAYRLKQELNIEPLVVFANDGPPPNVPTLSDEGYRMLCEDVLGFYRLFQPDTMDQYEKMGGRGNRAAEALIQKWSRGLRLFEEHARRTVARGDQALYHKFDCDLHVLVAQHSVDADLHFAKLEGPQREYWERRKGITGSNADSGCNWDRDAFKQWEPWTTEDFHYHEVDTDHMTIKNSPLMRKIVFKELGGFCGMDY